MMLRRLLSALRYALRQEDFGRILGAVAALIVVGTLTFGAARDEASAAKAASTADPADRS